MQERRARTLLAVTATIALVGIALSVVGDAGSGAWLTVGALVGLIVALHRLGRTGADEPLGYDE